MSRFNQIPQVAAYRVRRCMVTFLIILVASSAEAQNLHTVERCQMQGLVIRDAVSYRDLRFTPQKAQAQIEADLAKNENRPTKEWVKNTINRVYFTAAFSVVHDLGPDFVEGYIDSCVAPPPPHYTPLQ